MPFVTLPNLKMHYEEAGSGDDTLIMVHGNFASWRWWKPVMERLASGYHAYIPDLRGSGDTDRTPDGHTVEQLAVDIYEFVKALELSKLHLVGHSLGGAVSLQFTLDHPEMVYDLVLVAPAPAEGMPNLRKPAQHQSWLLGLFELFDPKNLASYLSPETLETTYRQVRTLCANRLFLKRAIMKMTPSWRHDDNPDFEALVDDAVRMSPEAMVGHLLSLEKWNVQARLDSVEQPVLILLGKQDVLVHPKEMKRTVQPLKRGRLVMWKGVGHSPQIERPERFMRLLTSFISRNKVPRPGLLWRVWERLSRPLRDRYVKKRQ
jgi:pimeloyl-ACP methyl ester carboxylesterase